MRIYRPKSLVTGDKIGLNTPSEFVAVPDKYDKDPVKIIYRGEEQIFSNWKKSPLTKTFPNKYGPGHYTLYYFEWDPKQEALFKEEV